LRGDGAAGGGAAAVGGAPKRNASNGLAMRRGAQQRRACFVPLWRQAGPFRARKSWLKNAALILPCRPPSTCLLWEEP
jgi:hypothetical protein